VLDISCRKDSDITIYCGLGNACELIVLSKVFWSFVIILDLQEPDFSSYDKIYLIFWPQKRSQTHLKLW